MPPWRKWRRPTPTPRWSTGSAGHASFFYPDGVHLAPAGAQFYATLVAGAVQPYKY